MKAHLLPMVCAIAGFFASDYVNAENDRPTSSTSAATDVEFEKPIRLLAGGEPIAVEEPGYACPAWTDMDGDGKKDLLVGQFAGGKVKIYKNLGDGKLAPGKWLEAEGSVANIPGVW